MILLGVCINKILNKPLVWRKNKWPYQKEDTLVLEQESVVHMML